MPRFADQTVIVTGAASGIGAEMARQFAAEGAHVIAADLHPVGAAEGTIPVEVDVADPASVERMVDGAIERFGRIDVLCNNAGVGSVRDVATCTVEEWDRVFAVNVRGVFLGTKLVVPHMLAQGGGAIVNTASVAGMVGFRDRAAYSASKGAVIALTRQVAVQYAAQGIRCNALCPGTVDSPWVQGLLSGSMDVVAHLAELVARQPVGRLGTPAEIARAGLYLASADATFVTGTTFVIDGGVTAA